MTPYRCDICRRYFISWATLGRHCFKYHRDALLRHEPSRFYDQRYRCVCNTVFYPKCGGKASAIDGNSAFGRHMLADGGPAAHALKYTLGVPDA